MMNKKAKIDISITGAFITAAIIGIIVLLILPSGGAKTIFNIGNFLTKVPAVVWVVLGVIILFRIVGGKRK